MDESQAPGPMEPPGLPPADPPARPPGRGFAITAFVLGLLGQVVPSVIFAIVALVRVRRGAAGRGLATAGLVASGLWVAAAAGAAAALVMVGGTHGVVGQVVGNDTSIAFLKVGDCVKTWSTEPVVYSVDVTPCSQPHEAEVYDRFLLTGDTYPGDAAVDDSARDRCPAEAWTLLRPDNWLAIRIEWLRPTATSWAHGDRRVECMAVTTRGPIAWSARATPG